MSNLCTEFQAEMMEILSCTELILSKKVTRRKRYSYCDSRAVIAAITTLAKPPPYQLCYGRACKRLSN
jgi:hypothetical protein